MGHLGFSYIGLCYLLLLFVPNLLWTRNQPPGYDASGEPKALAVCERVGQAACTCCALVFTDFNLAPFLGWWNVWLALSLTLMALYQGYWLRYFSRPSLENFYRPFCLCPVPGAALPVAAFFLLGVYGRVLWMCASACVLGVGHIGIHVYHLKRLRQAGAL